jgi:leucine dehydrogenase
VAAEIRGLETDSAFDQAWVDTKLDTLALTLAQVLDRAVAEGRPTHVVANEMARERIAAGARG